MIKIDAVGDVCPIPVVKTKNAIKELKGPGTVETLVDNEIAVQNLTKMANQKGYKVESKKIKDDLYSVVMTVGEAQTENTEQILTAADGTRGSIAVISSGFMGTGDDTLGAMLMKSFIFALTQQESLPKAVLFYNGGAKLTCEGSSSLEDISYLAEHGVEILTCGTCLKHYDLSDKLRIGGVTNMYEIVERMSRASHIIKP